MALRTNAKPKAVSRNPLTVAERAYIAGFFDGEGCVHFEKRRRGHPRLIMTQRTSEVLQWIHDTIGYGNLWVQHRTDGNSEWMWKLSIRRRQHIEWFIDSILEFSIVKQDKLDQAQEWLATRL